MKLQENQLFANRYLLDQKIGEGGFSEVWKAADQYITGTTVALKVYFVDSGLDQASLEIFSEEYRLTKSLRHNHLVEVIYYDIYQRSPYLVMPFYSNGSLAQVLYSDGPIDEMEIARIMLHVSDALDYLHRQDPPVVHRDIKPDNILINSNGDYLLSDFGISTRVRRTVAKHTGKSIDNSMSIAYAAPERFSSNPRTTVASDIFSFGVMINQLCTGELPWEENGGMALLRGAQVPNIPAIYSRKLNEIIIKCLDVEPLHRPTAIQLKEWCQSFLSEGYWPLGVKPLTEEKPPQKVKHKSKYLLPAVITGIVLLIILSFVLLNEKKSETPIVEKKSEAQKDTSIETISNNNDAESASTESLRSETPLKEPSIKKSPEKYKSTENTKKAGDDKLNEGSKKQRKEPQYVPSDLPKDTIQLAKIQKAKDSLKRVYQERQRIEENK